MTSYRRVSTFRRNMLPVSSGLKNYVKVWQRNLVFSCKSRNQRTIRHDANMLPSAVQYIICRLLLLLPLLLLLLSIWYLHNKWPRCLRQHRNWNTDWTIRGIGVRFQAEEFVSRLSTDIGVAWLITLGGGGQIHLSCKKRKLFLGIKNIAGAFATPTSHAYGWFCFCAL
jgi:hypothetical protein